MNDIAWVVHTELWDSDIVVDGLRIIADETPEGGQWTAEALRNLADEIDRLAG